MRRDTEMPLTAKGKKVLGRMKKTYGKEKAKQVFYAMINEGKLTGVEGESRTKKSNGKKEKTDGRSKRTR